MKVFAFRHSDCIHESAMGTISLHRTKEGAIKAMKKHKVKEKKEWEEMYKGEEPAFTFGYMEAWDVKETEIQP